MRSEITGRSGGSVSITVRKALTKSLLYEHYAAIHIKSHTQLPSLTHKGIDWNTTLKNQAIVTIQCYTFWNNPGCSGVSLYVSLE